MNKEVHYEGWLIKSPPSNRIWRSRWRRRWFTLKQGEIPEQFCLEYYTDHNCRKLKGVIDLDQCEQVDCGLRLENRKQKFQFMFDIKTPKRTYYLAADSAEDMCDWVNCICQVCHLHDTKHSLDVQDSNLVSKAIKYAITHQMTAIENTQSSSNNNGDKSSSDRMLDSRQSTESTLYSNMYQNSDPPYANAEHINELLNGLDSVRPRLTNISGMGDNAISNLLNGSADNDASSYLNTPILTVLSGNKATHVKMNVNGAVRKVPESLVLHNSPLSPSIQPSPSLSTSSGPYIPISECFSGLPKYFDNPTTPLNNLDPKFYDTPRSHNNIGLNLTNDQSYSPKMTNCCLQQITSAKNCRKANSHSDSDSESVFTDDDEWTYPMPLRENVDRNTRPSDSSVENDSFIVTYSQRFSKLPDVGIDTLNEYKMSSPDKNHEMEKLEKLYKNKKNLFLDLQNERTSRDVTQLSDTENNSPQIEPQDLNSVVEDCYDIPRSHRLPYYNLGQLFEEKIWSPERKITSTPMPICRPSSPTSDPKSDTQTIFGKHLYTNAAPNTFQANVFRYDFIEKIDLPPVNRKLKPKIMDKSSEKPKIKLNTSCTEQFTDDIFSLRPPSVDRNLKPNVYKLGNLTLMDEALRRSVRVPLAMAMPTETNNYILETHTLPRTHNTQAVKSDAQIDVCQSNSSALHQRSISAIDPIDQTSVNSIALTNLTGDGPVLQYFDLDLASPPTLNRQSMSTTNLSTLEPNKADILGRSLVKSGVVYNSVDFVKTEAFKRIREERKKESEGVNFK